ncbi:hypothetical protein [Afipia sp. Root123D2]|uniref:hypothetical protein n=1 Tax=Afipia sp. Root123D2 TaxID=1736436 RepID=UPI0012E85409|nr:hypothetical protein [Afipia sp. Root123D2]
MLALPDAERRKLEAQLHEQLRQDCDQSEAIGYRPKIFRQMLAESGPVEACLRVIMTDKIPDGFITLLEKKRLDLTAEATILRGPWRVLFQSTELDRARNRLRQYGRPDLAVP